MSTAGMVARLGLDRSNFDRGIDGAEKKTAEFVGSVRGVKKAIGAAFAASALYGFMAAFRDVQEAQQGGIKLVSDEDLRNIESVAASIKALKLDVEATAVTGVSRFVSGLKAASAWAGTLTNQLRERGLLSSNPVEWTKAAVQTLKSGNGLGGKAAEDRAQAMAGAMSADRQRMEAAEASKLATDLAKARAALHISQQSPTERLADVRKQWVTLTAQLDAGTRKGLLTEKERLDLELRRIALLKEDDELVGKIGASYKKEFEAAQSRAKADEAARKEASRHRIASIRSDSALKTAQSDLDASLTSGGGKAGELKANLRARAAAWETARKEASAMGSGNTFEEREARKAAQVRVLETRKAMVESEKDLRSFYAREGAIRSKASESESKLRSGIGQIPALSNRLGGLTAIGGLIGNVRAAAEMSAADRGRVTQERIAEISAQMLQELRNLNGEEPA